MCKLTACGPQHPPHPRNTTAPCTAPILKQGSRSPTPPVSSASSENSLHPTPFAPLLPFVCREGQRVGPRRADCRRAYAPCSSLAVPPDRPRQGSVSAVCLGKQGAVGQASSLISATQWADNTAPRHHIPRVVRAWLYPLTYTSCSADSFPTVQFLALCPVCVSL